KADVGRSLIWVGLFLDATGKADEALAVYRRSEALLAKLASSDAAARASLASCRASMAWVLANTGRTADALAAYKLAKADEEVGAAGPGATNSDRSSLAGTVISIAALLLRTGRPSQAEVELRHAIPIFHKLAGDDPSVTQFRLQLASALR